MCFLSNASKSLGQFISRLQNLVFMGCYFSSWSSSTLTHFIKTTTTTTTLPLIVRDWFVLLDFKLKPAGELGVQVMEWSCFQKLVFTFVSSNQSSQGLGACRKNMEDKSESCYWANLCRLDLIYAISNQQYFIANIPIL